jgi:hypothetical protein
MFKDILFYDSEENTFNSFIAEYRIVKDQEYVIIDSVSLSQ